MSQAGADGAAVPGLYLWGEEGSSPVAYPRNFPPELADRGARVVIDSGRPIAHVARDLVVPAGRLRRWLRRVEPDEGLQADRPTSAEREEIKQLRRKVYELRRASEIPKAHRGLRHHPRKTKACRPRRTYGGRGAFTGMRQVSG